MKYITIILLFFVGSLSYVSAQSVEDKIYNNKVAFISKALELTPTEAEKFWPLYREYNEAKEKYYSTKDQYKKKYPESETEAKEWINLKVENESSYVKAKSHFTREFQKILPSTKVVKMFKAEYDFHKKLIDEIHQRKNK